MTTSSKGSPFTENRLISNHLKVKGSSLLLSCSNFVKPSDADVACVKFLKIEDSEIVIIPEITKNLNDNPFVRL